LDVVPFDCFVNVTARFVLELIEDLRDDKITELVLNVLEGFGQNLLDYLLLACWVFRVLY
jgi:hypothetical protein